ncbi:MAG: hypothetical protein IPJ88_06840 [Myxococcales bacterium]|nr:MAG: hypothetical protein IPJ88_06840 [Myxococcales bacterium]
MKNLVFYFSLPLIVNASMFSKNVSAQEDSQRTHRVVQPQEKSAASQEDKQSAANSAQARQASPPKSANATTSPHKQRSDEHRSKDSYAFLRIVSENVLSLGSGILVGMLAAEINKDPEDPYESCDTICINRGALGGFVLGLTVGMPLGTYLGGELFPGSSHFGWTMLPGVVGSAMMLGAANIEWNNEGTIWGVLLGLGGFLSSWIGSIVAYEINHELPKPQSVQVALSVAPSARGKGATLQLNGRF